MELHDDTIILREEVFDSDTEAVRRITASTGFFAAEEIDVAVELVEERLAKGMKSGYYFIFAVSCGAPVAYSCYGPIACTVSSYDLFWIVVSDTLRGKNIGTRLLALSEQRIRELGGTRIYVETSSRKLYDPTRKFYEKRDYRKEAVLDDFYAPGDAKVIYVKEV